MEWTPVEQTATNPQTGAKMAMVGGQWQPATETATNPQTGKKMARLQAAPVATAKPEAPAGADDEGAAARPHTMKEAAAHIGLSTSVGAAVGAFAPELTMLAGAGVMALPFGQLPGGLLMDAGAAMRIGRGTAAALGALSGGVGAVVGEGARATGKVTETGAAAAELAGGAVAPAAVAGLVTKSAKGAWTLFRSITERTAVGELPAKDSAKILQGKFEGKIPENDLYLVAKAGADADVKASEELAQKTIRDSYVKAQQLAASDQKAADAAIAAGRQKAEQIRQEASARMAKLHEMTGNRTKHAAAVSKLSEAELQKVGTDRTVSAIGTELRDTTTKVQGAALEARATEYGKLKAVRDQAVSNQEKAGVFVDAMPEMKALKQELDTKLLRTKAGQAAATITTEAGKKVGLAPVTESGVERAYAGIREAIGNKRVQTGVNEAGSPTYQTFKTTFEALDHVRRKLGDVAFKGEKEGYGALGQSIAKDMYGKIAAIQEKYAGESQKALQSHYAAATGDLKKFETMTGRKMTAVDRIDPEVFSKDPAGIAGGYFKTRQGVQDLLELTQNPTVVARAAEDYSRQQVGGKSAEQVRKWLADPVQKDWVPEMPGLQKKLTDYAARLEKIESAAGKLTASAQKLQKERQALIQGTPEKMVAAREAGVKEAAGVLGKSPERQAAVVAAGEKEAAGITKAAKAKAEAVAASGFPVEDVRKVLTGGLREGLVQLMRQAAGTPGGREAVEGSVRQALARAARTPGQMRELWDGRLKVALEESRVLPQAQMAKLDKDVQEAWRKLEPAKAAKKTEWLVRAALGAAGGTVAGGVVEGVERLRGD